MSNSGNHRIEYRIKIMVARILVSLTLVSPQLSFCQESVRNEIKVSTLHIGHWFQGISNKTIDLSLTAKVIRLSANWFEDLKAPQDQPIDEQIKTTENSTTFDNYEIYPYPASSVLIVEGDFKERKAMFLRTYQGQKIATNLEIYKYGSHRFLFDLRKIEVGIYYLQIGEDYHLIRIQP